MLDHMIIRSIFLIAIFLWPSFSSHSQGKDEWFDGTIVLASGELVWGKINYNLQHDLAICKQGALTKTYSPYQVNYLRYYDEGLQVNRYFKVIEEKKNQFKKKGFYEVVLDGTLPLVRKQKPYLLDDNESIEKDYDYYVISREGLVNVFYFKKTVVKKMMNDYQFEIRNYANKEKLSYYRLKDQIMILDFYNSMSNSKYNAVTKAGY
jgi:hypothetical protein